MGWTPETSNLVLISISVIFGALALTLACVGIGTSNWQTYIGSTANFFYACQLDSNGMIVSCKQRSANNNVVQYYSINATGNASDWNLHLNTAAAFSIMGIIYIFIGTMITLALIFVRHIPWFILMSPSFLFLACLYMLAGLAEGARILVYNGYSANLYQTAHLLTIASFFMSAIIAGRLFDSPVRTRQIKKVKRAR